MEQPMTTRTSSGRSRISARLASLAPSATLAIDAKAKALRAAGEDVVGFGAGEPDFPTPAHIVEAAQRAAADPANHRYTPTAGLPELREAIAAKTRRDSGVEASAAQVLVTNGGKHAVYNAMVALLDDGDEVLLPVPYWTTYPEAVRLAGGVPVPVPTSAAQGFVPSVEALEAALTERTKVLVVNSPSNPSGAVWPPERLAEIGRFAAEAGLWVVSDEIYERLVYGAARFASITAVPELDGRWVILHGVAKTWAMTGWRVGWMVGPADLVAAAINFQSHTTSNVSNVAQRAALAALTGPQDSVAEMRDAFDRRRRAIVAALSAMPGVDCPEPSGAFYAFPDFSGVLGRTVRGRRPATSSELAEVVLDEAKVAFVPGEAFGAPGFGRFSYALGDAALSEGMDRLAKLLAEAS
jgi:aspartate aminotransferase